MEPADPQRPEQLTQTYFWGSHIGIGGGSYSKRHCSAITLRFAAGEIRRRGLGLALNTEEFPEMGDVLADVKPTKRRNDALSIYSRLLGESSRTIPSVSDVDRTVVQRYQKRSDWRPRALDHLHDDILSIQLDEDGARMP